MKIKFVSTVLSLLLIGLFLPGCVSKAELEECKTLVAEQAILIQSQNTTIAEQAGQIEEVSSKNEKKDARISKLEEESNKLKAEKVKLEAEIECLRQPPPEKVLGEIAGYISYKKTVEAKRKFFPKGKVGGYIAASARGSHPLMSVETLKQFLAGDQTNICPPCRPNSNNNCDELAFRLKAHWIEAGLSPWSLSLGKVETDTQYGRMLCWRNIFLTKEKGEFVFYEVDPRTDKITKIEEPSEVYRIVIICDKWL